MSLTNLQIMAREAPELAGAVLSKNGFTTTIPDLFQSYLDEAGQVVELALANLFATLTVEDRAQTITLGEFSTTRRADLNFDERRYYWERRYRQTLIGQQGAAPVIQIGGAFAPYPVPPAVR